MKRNTAKEKLKRNKEFPYKRYGRNRSKIYKRKCKRCHYYFETIYKSSRICPNCDLRYNINKNSDDKN